MLTSLYLINKVSSCIILFLERKTLARRSPGFQAIAFSAIQSRRSRIASPHELSWQTYNKVSVPTT
jgi:hypothetical protein